MSDPHEPAGLSVTIKAEGNAAPWLVFKGSPDRIREQILDVFDLDNDGAPLYDLVNQVSRIFRSTGNVTSQLGGRVIETGASEQSPSSSGGSAWNKVRNGETPPPEEDPTEARHLAQIDAQASVAELKRYWAANRAAFDASAKLMAAYSAKGKALTEAGK